jgi:predicted MPP superfamily phosphohydrolase
VKDRKSNYPLWRRLRLVLIAIALLTPLHFYVGTSLLEALPEFGAAWLAGAAALALSCVIIPVGLMARFAQRQALADALAWTGSIALGFFSTLFVLTLLRDLALIPALALAPAWALSVALPWSAAVVPAAAVLATAIGFANARYPARVVEVEVPIAGLPAALEGFTIAQVSDLHVGTTIRRPFVERVVERTNALGADLIAVTGDLVDGSVPALAPHVAPIARLSAPHGVYFITGNHEYYSGEPAWSAEVSRLGLRVLKNEHVVLRHNGAALVLAGVTDFSAGQFDPAQHSDPRAALRGAPPQATKILLAHQPRSAFEAAEAGFDLQLSGHTHGGQFWPWNLFVRLQQPFTAGLHRVGRLWVYTSRGTGYWGPPKRFGAPSEVTRLRLVGAALQAAPI